MNRGFRQSQSTLHTWSGLLLGWVLFIIFIAGTAAYWREPLNRWMRPETPRVERPLEALAGAQRFLERKVPDAKTWFVTIAGTDGPGTYVFWVPQPDPKAKERRRRRDTFALIGADGAPVARETRGGDFFYRFHFDLHYMPVIWARWLVGVAAMMMLVAILTGIVTHKKIFKDFFTLRREKGQRSWLDGHNATAVLGLPFHLMITYTGLVTLATMLMPWATVANYADSTTLFPASEAVARTGRPAPLVDLAALVRDGEHQLGGPVGFIEVAEPGDVAARVTMTRASKATLATYGARVTYDGVTGRLLWRSPPPNGAITTYGAMIGLHAGRFGDLTMRWLYFLCGLGGTVMVASGLVLWTVKRREKLADPLRPPFGFRVVERLNIAVIAGFPLGCTGFFLANRLLPLATPDRAEREITVLFVTWGIATLAALALRPVRGWTVLLGATAIGLVAVVACDLLVLRPGLVQWIAASDWLMATVDAVLLVLAIGFTWTARRVARHRPRVRKPRAIHTPAEAARLPEPVAAE
ncbi:peptidase [Sphingomonas sp. Leaf339]|uniref:PepSY-associated TM helix domain-containing protein n=1 Tax=Sphingomonas sp. Leaf339 TaxID=1736343 RepID=UPI0006F2E3FA|nr:PepSY-associated TM helix domain-containing protein [Sphingomonas sp. Leaf339]KQU46030.1 peptidase [Sphingomonas sp. Leaf339]